MAKVESQPPRFPGAPRTQTRPRAMVSPGYLLPLATAALVGACFLVYYLTYVQQHREYLLNRDYRVLATMGEQMSETLANQTAVLTSYVNSFEYGGFDETLPREHVHTDLLEPGQPKKTIKLENDLIQVGNVSTDPTVWTSISIHSFAPRLNHVLIRHYASRFTKRVNPALIRRDGEWSFQLAALDKDEDHEASGTISLQDLSLSFSSSIAEGTFDDVLIAVDDRNYDHQIVYQKQRIGPHFSSLADLVKNAVLATAAPGAADKDGSPSPDSGGSAPKGSGQVIETELAGVPYMVFLEPVTVDLNPNQDGRGQVTTRLTMVGLVPSRTFRWQSLAISYRAVILFSSVFLLLCLITPILKIRFLNERGRLLRREIVLLPLLFATIAGALTSICLQTIYFNLRHDDTDVELGNLSGQMQTSINSEITHMRDQLVAACREIAGDDSDGLSSPHYVIRRNILKTPPEGLQPLLPEPAYPYFNNIFWTDSNGIQIVKWSATSVYTPLIDVSRLPFFRNLDTDNHYFFLGKDKPFRFDSVLPPNQDSYVGVLGMRMSDCPSEQSVQFKGMYMFLTAPPMSLIDPILPVGAGFALVDDTGLVLFHSDKYRNNRENILEETSYNRELTASLYGHSNQDNFSLDYRGHEVRARVVPVSGINQSPWSLIVFKDMQYSQTYALEVLTMSGALLFGYIGLPALIVFLFYMFVRMPYVPDWLWPSRAAWRIYRFQIVAASVMLALSVALTFWRPIEESLYAAVACGYVTLIIIFASALHGKPPSAARTVFQRICGVIAMGLVAFAVWKRWWWSAVPIGLVLFPFAWVLRSRRYLAVARGRFSGRSYRSLYGIRALILLSVVGILPPLSFFRNSMRLEDRLQIRVAQLQAARDWNSRERKIETEVRDVPALGAYRCSVEWDSYLGSYFTTEAHRQGYQRSDPSSDLDEGFLRFAHFLYHSYNNIGAEAIGVIKNPALPESVFLQGSPSAIPEWEWEWVPKGATPSGRARLRVHEGADDSNVCAAGQPDLVVSSIVPPEPVSVSAISNVVTWLIVTAVMTLLFRSVRKIFLFDLEEPLQQSGEKVQAALKGPGNVLVLTASKQDWRPELAGDGASRIDVRALSADPAWGERFDASSLPAEGRAVVESFDWELGSADSDRQRLILMERLTAHVRNATIVSAVDPLPFLVDHPGSGTAANAGGWAAVLGAFRRINLGHRTVWAHGEKIKKQSRELWRECSVQPELYPVAEDLWRAWNSHRPMEPEQLVAEVGERAAEYYHLVWRSCTQEECFLLTGLARDGMVNPNNVASLRQLLRRKLVVRAPQFRIMNESFRRFAIAQAAPMQQEWDAEAAGSGWGKARGPFATALVMVGLFLLSTQQQFLQTSAGLLTIAGGSVGALLKLIGVAQGRSSNR
jgi:hypothetical protein